MKQLKELNLDEVLSQQMEGFDFLEESNFKRHFGNFLSFENKFQTLFSPMTFQIPVSTDEAQKILVLEELDYGRKILPQRKMIHVQKGSDKNNEKPIIRKTKLPKLKKFFSKRKMKKLRKNGIGKEKLLQDK